MEMIDRELHTLMVTISKTKPYRISYDGTHMPTVEITNRVDVLAKMRYVELEDLDNPQKSREVKLTALGKDYLNEITKDRFDPVIAVVVSISQVHELSSIMSERFGDMDRSEDPQIDRMFDLIDDVLGVTGKDRCDYGEA